MHPAERKAKSEELLRRRGAPINEHLPLIESDDEVVLRSADELLKRLVALWAVVGTAFLRGNDHFRSYVVENGFQSWLSKEELAFLLSDSPTERDYICFTWKLECLYFLAWCAGLIDDIELPEHESSVESIMHLFPGAMEKPTVLGDAIAIRPKSEILDWSDLLYRLHWSVRECRITGRAGPPGINGGVVQEWHQAVNWMTRYDDEDDWDMVGTDT